jgi:hypothetical protein
VKASAWLRKGEEIMRKLTVNTMRILAAALFCVAGAGVARAQDDQIVAKVPFDFTVGDTHLQAGKYTVKSTLEDPGVLAIESSDGHQVVCTLTIPMSWGVPARDPELVFEREDNQYVLSRLIWADGTEREILRKHARSDRDVAVAPAIP